MDRQTQYIRFGFGSVRPYLHGPVDLPEFLRKAFGAIELERHEFGPESFHVASRIGDSVVIIEAGTLPRDVPPWVGSVYVYVDDVDGVYRRALELGATSIAEPEEKPYSERSAGFKDTAGNIWWIATYKP